MMKKTLWNARSYPVLFLLPLLIVACGGQETAVIQPTTVPLDPDVIMVIVPAQPITDPAVLTELGDALSQETGLIVAVESANEVGEALDRLCQGEAVVWLDGFSYAAARAQNCGDPALQIARSNLTQQSLIADQWGLAVDQAESTPEAITVIPTDEMTLTPEATPDENALPADLFTGMPGVIVVDAQFGATGLGVIQGRAFCRLGIDDLYSWLLPVTVLGSANIDPFGAQVSAVDRDSLSEIIESIQTQDCVMTGLPQAAYELLSEEQQDAVTVINTTPALPYGIMLYPAAVNEATRETISAAILTIANDDETADQVRPLLAHDAIVPIDEEALGEFDAFIASTRLDFGALGN